MERLLYSVAASEIGANGLVCNRHQASSPEGGYRGRLAVRETPNTLCTKRLKAATTTSSPGSASNLPAHNLPSKRGGLRAFDASHEAEGVIFEVTADGQLIPCPPHVQEPEDDWDQLSGLGAFLSWGEIAMQAESDDAEEMGSKSVWAKLGQRLNLSGIAFASRIVLSEQHLAIPHVSVQDISWIDWPALRKHGFQGVVFDKDNTLTAPYKLDVWPSLIASLEECKSVFEGRVALLSNSAGLNQYDPDGSEARKLETSLNIAVIRHDVKKPGGSADKVGKHFGCEPSLLVMVGDRYFTDVVYGNRNGLLTIRPAPLTLVGEPFIVQQVRKLEDSLVQRWEQSGVLPTTHELFTNASNFVKDRATC